MIPLATLLQHLTRAEVTEVCLASGRRPVARQGGKLHDLGGEELSSDDLMSVLFAAGGSRYVDTLGEKAAQWRTRIEGVGALTVSATMNGDVIEARFALRDAAAHPAAPAPPPPRPRAPSSPHGKAGPRSNRARGAEGMPSSRGKTGRSGRPPAPEHHGLRGRPPPPPEPLDDDDRPSTLPTPPRGTQVPREAMRSMLELELEVEIPSIPTPQPAAAPPRKATPPPLPPRAAPPPLPRKGTPPPLPRKGTPPPLPQRPAPPAASRNDTPAPEAAVATRPPAPAFEDAPRAVAPPLPPVVVTQAHDEPPAGLAPISPRTLPEARFASSAPGPGAERRTRSTGRTTRPFGREPYTPVFRRLLLVAREANASDLHIVAGRPALLRMVGQVQPWSDPLDAHLVEDMVLSRVPRRLEEALEREGSCDFSLEEPELGRFRVNVGRYRGGIKASLRLVPLYVPTLATLGLPESIAAATRHHQGLIVLAGPNGHGKTSTLSALVDILNTETTRHVITVEDPIELVHPRKRALLSQREVGTHTRSFQTALKAALREDPDVIVIGELRDAETVRIALEASETGHLVLGTMSTPSAARAIDRLIDLFPPGEQQQVRTTLAGGLRLIVSQRLVPDTAGRSMVAAAELLPGILPLWNLIRDNRTYQIPSLQQRGRELGVVRLDESLRELVRAGKTTAAAAVAVAESPDELEQSLGIRRPTPPPAPGSQPGAAPGRGTYPVRPDGKPPAPEPSKGIFDRVFKKGV